MCAGQESCKRCMFTPQHIRMPGPVFKPETDNECGQFAEGGCH